MRAGRIVGMVVAMLWLSCLFFPAMKAGKYDLYSIFFLLWGWLGLMIFEIDWLTNPALLCFVLIMFGRIYRPKALVATGALLFILLLKNAVRTTMIVNENQNSAIIDQHYIGWYLWIGAQIVAIAATCVALIEPQMMGLVSRADFARQEPSHQAV
jgi:hypothetical protein